MFTRCRSFMLLPSGWLIVGVGLGLAEAAAGEGEEDVIEGGPVDLRGADADAGVIGGAQQLRQGPRAVDHPGTDLGAVDA